MAPGFISSKTIKIVSKTISCVSFQIKSNYIELIYRSLEMWKLAKGTVE
jgi:hypothetical protein